jgi:hypothetical protein
LIRLAGSSRRRDWFALAFAPLSPPSRPPSSHEPQTANKKPTNGVTHFSDMLQPVSPATPFAPLTNTKASTTLSGEVPAMASPATTTTLVATSQTKVHPPSNPSTEARLTNTVTPTATSAAVVTNKITVAAGTPAKLQTASPASTAASYHSRLNRSQLMYEDEKDLNNLDRLRLSMQPINLKFYGTPPSQEVTIDEFIKSGDDRLAVLNYLHQAELKRVQLKIKAKKGDVHLSDLLHNLQSSCSNILIQHHMNNESWDTLSHFVLRLAFCQNEQKRRWFLERETALFQFRLEHMLLQLERNCVSSRTSSTSQATRVEKALLRFLSDNGFNFSYVSKYVLVHHLFMLLYFTQYHALIILIISRLSSVGSVICHGTSMIADSACLMVVTVYSFSSLSLASVIQQALWTK